MPTDVTDAAVHAAVEAARLRVALCYLGDGL